MPTQTNLNKCFWSGQQVVHQCVKWLAGVTPKVNFMDTSHMIHTKVRKATLATSGPENWHFCWLVRVSLLIKVPVRTPRDLWFTNSCKFLPTFWPIEIKYVNKIPMTPQMTSSCETAMSRQFDAILVMFVNNFLRVAYDEHCEEEDNSADGGCCEAVLRGQRPSRRPPVLLQGHVIRIHGCTRQIRLMIDAIGWIVTCNR